LDSVHLAAVKEAVALRSRFTRLILQLAGDAARSGTPVVRSLEYVFPHQALENVNDEFMLGDDWLVAPVLTASPLRKVVFPKGSWKDARGHVFKGPGIKEYNVALNELPYFERIK
jgi:alpha-glucosidase (family GH31 glycosyl hydrolase)